MITKGRNDVYGLHKATAYYNKLEAWRDWDAMVQRAGNVSVHELARIAPKPTAGWKTIDNAIAKLRKLIEP
jgi:hypothetical protein